MANIAELRWFEIITNPQEQEMIQKVEEWNAKQKVAKKVIEDKKGLLNAINDIANQM